MSARSRILPLFIPHLACPHTCVFCNQKRISGALKPVAPDDITAALNELCHDDHGIELAFYGGSFTALPFSEQESLLARVQPYLDKGIVSGIRVSTRPDAIHADVLMLLKEMGVTTVELGAQSMCDEVLACSGRGHTANDTRIASALLKAHGFQLILQMMTGLPGSCHQADVETGREICRLQPDGVRIYPTVILRDTCLYELWKAGAYREHTVDDAVTVCAEILPMFDTAGIPVIRLGLNPTEELSGGAAVAGAYHPALGELVRSRILLNRALDLFCELDRGGDVALAVRPGELSQMIGQRRCNVLKLTEAYELRSLKIVPMEQLSHGEVRRIDCAAPEGAWRFSCT